MGVNLLFTVDVDNDGVENNERTNLSWTSIARIPEIKMLFQSFGLHATWFVRADNQLEDVYGTAAFLLLEYESLWNQLEHSGDEIAWHPHLYEWSESHNKYFADLDGERCAQKLRATRKQLIGRGFTHTSVRVGEGYHSNATMKELYELSLSIDSTAIPGRFRQDEARSFDWSLTPNEPYYPSQTDYRKPDLHSHWDVLEVPMTTVLTQASYDVAPVRRYINLAYHHAAFKAGIDWLLNTFPQGECEHFLVTILHPDEIAPRDTTHPLYSFSINEVQQNIAYLLSTLSTGHWSYRSIRMNEVISIWLSQQGQEKRK